MLLQDRGTAELSDVLGRTIVERNLGGRVAKRVGIFEQGKVLRHGVPQIIDVIGRMRKWWSEIVLGFIVAIKVMSSHVFLFFRERSECFQLTAEDHSEAIAAEGLLHTGNVSAIAPIVHFAAESVAFGFESAKLTSGESSMTAGGVDVGDRGVDDGGLGRATNLRQVGKESG
jgi:hypothetical protein